MKNLSIKKTNRFTISQIKKGMKKGKAGFKRRYGKDADSVMYATATKLAKK